MGGACPLRPRPCRAAATTEAPAKGEPLYIIAEKAILTVGHPLALPLRRRRRSPLQLFESPLAAPRKISYKIKKAAPKTARFHKKTKPQNSACEAASAALSGLAFHQGVPGWRSHASPGGACDRPNRSALCADAAHRFGAARLRPSALHLPSCSGFTALRGFCKTFVFLCHARLT